MSSLTILSEAFRSGHPAYSFFSQLQLWPQSCMISSRMVRCVLAPAQLCQ
ncbi:MAG: hypothetical protein J6U31_03210 [Bacteroidales bacterium]|nr:hypothetical protein [Bacteroidales bacterium]